MICFRRATSGHGGPSQQQAFDLVKKAQSCTTVLALYDPSWPTTVSADASSFGLGAILLQTCEEVRCPVAFALRAMTPT